MALIEVELLVERFSQFVQFVAATGPIPIGTVSALGPSRLIASFGWNQVTVGPAPPGFVVPSGALTARCDVTLRHVSTAQLDPPPFSLTLRDGKVAALFENTLVIGRPWHAPRVVRG